MAPERGGDVLILGDDAEQRQQKIAPVLVLTVVDALSVDFRRQGEHILAETVLVLRGDGLLQLKQQGLIAGQRPWDDTDIDPVRCRVILGFQILRLSVGTRRHDVRTHDEGQIAGHHGAGWQRFVMQRAVAVHQVTVLPVVGPRGFPLLGHGDRRGVRIFGRCLAFGQCLCRRIVAQRHLAFARCLCRSIRIRRHGTGGERRIELRVEVPGELHAVLRKLRHEAEIVLEICETFTLRDHELLELVINLTEDSIGLLLGVALRTDRDIERNRCILRESGDL